MATVTVAPAEMAPPLLGVTVQPLGTFRDQAADATPPVLVMVASKLTPAVAVSGAAKVSAASGGGGGGALTASAIGCSMTTRSCPLTEPARDSKKPSDTPTCRPAGPGTTSGCTSGCSTAASLVTLTRRGLASLEPSAGTEAAALRSPSGKSEIATALPQHNEDGSAGGARARGKPLCHRNRLSDGAPCNNSILQSSRQSLKRSAPRSVDSRLVEGKERPCRGRRLFEVCNRHGITRGSLDPGRRQWLSCPWGW